MQFIFVIFAAVRLQMVGSKELCGGDISWWLAHGI